MPRKQIYDLPSDVLIEIRMEPNPGEIWFTAIDHEGEPYYAQNPELDGEFRPLFLIIVEALEDPVSQKQVLRICNAGASKGWGPFIYDLVIEFASTKGYLGVVTGTGLNADSTGLWKKYRDERDDVVKHFLAADHPWINDLPIVDPDFPFLLSKEPHLIHQLEQEDRIVWRGGQDGF